MEDKMNEAQLSKLITAMIRMVLVTVSVVAALCLGTIAYVAGSEEQPVKEPVKDCECEKVKCPPPKKLMAFGQAMDRGFLKRDEIKYAVKMGWVYLAEIQMVSGGKEWIKVAIPLEEDRERYARHWERSRIKVVLLEDVTGPLPSMGIVTEATVH
jgi:hypothetical protein